MKRQREPHTNHHTNDGRPLRLSFHEAMIYTRLDRCMLSFITLYHLHITAREANHMILEDLDRCVQIAKRYPKGPPPKFIEALIRYTPRRHYPPNRQTLAS
jgi:hypothetical protein